MTNENHLSNDNTTILRLTVTWRLLLGNSKDLQDLNLENWDALFIRDLI